MTEELDLRALADRLRAVEDRLEIHQVLMRYSRGVDRGEAELLRSVYHEGAVDRHGPAVFDDAHTQFAEYAVPGVDAMNNPTQHHITNSVIELDGDAASGESYFLAYQPAPPLEDGTEITGLIGGRYLDRFERRAGRWAIVERTVVVEWSRELAGEPLPGSDGYALPGRREADPSHDLLAGLRARLAGDEARASA